MRAAPAEVNTASIKTTPGMAASKAVKFGPRLKELRIHLCQTSSASKGVRECIEANYVSLKQANPTIPILVRECSGIYPQITARYEYGQESSVPAVDMSSDSVLKQIEQLATK